MKRVWPRVIAAGGVLIMLAALYFMFGTGQTYKSLTQDDAARIMENDPDCLIVDVRTQTEYDGGHIPGAVCVPVDDIRNGKFDALPDKYQTLLIYCYAGRRAVDAAKILTAAGYRNTYEFGGIVDWKGPVTDPLPIDDETDADDTQTSADASGTETNPSADTSAS